MGTAESKNSLYDDSDAYSITVPGSETETAGAIHRANFDGVGPELSLFGCYTTYETFRRGVSLFPQNPCLGYRAIDAHGQASPYIWYTYAQVAARADDLGAGLMHEGLMPPNEDGMRLLAIYMKNQPEWVIAEQACFTAGGATVPLYDTLGPESAAYVLRQTGAAAAVCARAELPKLTAVAAAGSAPAFQTAIVAGPAPTAADLAAARAAGLRVFGLGELERRGGQHPRAHTPPAPTDVATFCYTSGTTGDPKGALITHQNFISDSAAAQRIGVAITAADSCLSFLPLPHIFERNLQVSFYVCGGAVGFYQGDPLKIMEDFVALRPTFSAIVPRLLNRLHDKILAGVAAAGGAKQALFERALAAKTAGLRAGTTRHALWDALVFGKLRASLGWDRLRVLITGSAPVAPYVLDLARCILAGADLLEGYGQTETTAAATVTRPGDLTAGHVGAPVPCCELRLVDVPDMGYLHTDTWHGGDPVKGGGGGEPCRGRGEICFRGPNVFAGYYKMPEKTAEAIDAGGWLHSGDIGLWTPEGKLKIIDRKKNLFKLAQGEYVAPERVENALLRAPLAAQAFVHGDSLESFLVAVVVPDPEEAEAWAKANGKDGASLEALCSDPQFLAAIKAESDRVGAEAGLAGYERPRTLHVDPTPFSVEEGLLTPTLKLRRDKAKQKYAEILKNLYAKAKSQPPARL